MSSVNETVDIEKVVKRAWGGSRGIRRSILRALSREGWMSLRDLESKTSIAQKTLSSTLEELELEEVVLGLDLPSSNRASASFFHLVTEESRALESDGWPIIGVDALPWDLEREFMPKLAEYCRRESLSLFKKHIAAKFALDSRLSEAGLCEYRSRPNDGFYYRCAWRINLDHQLFTSAFEAMPGEVSLGVTFLGVLPSSLFMPLKTGIGLDEPALSKRLGQGCLVAITQKGASVLLNNLVYGRAGIEELPALNATLSRINIIESTKKLLNEAAELSVLASPFLPIEQTQFHLFTEAAGGKEKP